MISGVAPGALVQHVSEERLVDTARALVDISSPTGHELEMAEHMRALLEELGLSIAWQEVEQDRPNVVGTLAGERRRAEPDVQRPHGYLVLGLRVRTFAESASGREPW